MDLREKVRGYMEQQRLTRAELARRVGLAVPVLCKYLEHRYDGLELRQTEAALTAYLKRAQLVERQREKKFLQLQTSALVLERCEEARKQKELVVLYGPPGISKTYSLREYVRRRADANDDKVLLVTANAVTTPRGLVVALCQLLRLPTDGPGYVLLESVIDKLNQDPHFILVDEANHLTVEGLEVLRHIHDMAECGMVLAGTKRLYDLFTAGGRKSQDLEQLWSRVAIHDLLPGLSPAEIRHIVQTSMGRLNETAMMEIERSTRGSARRLAKLLPRLRRLQELNPGMPPEKLVGVAARKIIA